jgi:hypothetical protein
MKIPRPQEPPGKAYLQLIIMNTIKHVDQQTKSISKKLSGNI